MQPANYTYITTAATNVISGTATNRVNLIGISLNKVATGTITVKADSTTIGVIAASTPAGMYFNTVTGMEVQKLTITNASTEDFTVIWTNL